MKNGGEIVYFPRNENGRRLLDDWLVNEGRSLRLPYHRTCRFVTNRTLGRLASISQSGRSIELLKVACEDMMTLAMHERRTVTALMFSDLFLNFLYGCETLEKREQGLPAQPKDVFDDSAKGGRVFQCQVDDKTIIAAVREFEQHLTNKFCMLVPNGKDMSDLVGATGRKQIRVAYEKRFRNIARVFLTNEKIRFTPLEVFRGADVICGAGYADAALDLVNTGRTARAHGLKPVVNVLTVYPLVVRIENRYEKLRERRRK
jgi:hypothetical protein